MGEISPFDHNRLDDAEKSFVNRKPQTRLALTAEGRRAWRAWLDRIDALRSAAGQ